MRLRGQPRLQSEREIKRYLRAGDHDPKFTVWPGNGFFARATEGNAALRKALIKEVRRREAGRRLPESLVPPDLVALTRAKVTPMVRGLFPRCEQEVIINLLERSVVFLTPDNIERILEDSRWLGTAWSLANLYLDSIGAPLLAKDARRIVGLSEETTCYVSLRYLKEGNRFADFIVHETAHVFHNCKRETVGLRGTRTREWLLNINFRNRETFAYACEAYSRILEQGRGPTERRKLLADLEVEGTPSEDRVDAEEYIAILRDAVASRSGWKRILARCADSRRMRKQV